MNSSLNDGNNKNNNKRKDAAENKITRCENE